MATAIVAKPSKRFFSNKKLKLSFSRLLRPTPKSLPPRPNDTGPASLDEPPNSTKEDDKFRDVFNHLDADKDGKISGKELMDYLASVGESVTHSMAKKVINEFDSDGDDFLGFGDFVRLMEQEDNEADDVLRSAFQMFEVEKGCGCITPKGLQQMLRQLGDEKSQDECAAMIRVFDLDGNGFLDFHEFQQMMSRPS